MECYMRGATILFLSLILLAGCDGFGSLTDEEYVAQAKGALDKGDLAVARINLKNALKENANNSEARVMLGSIYFDVGDYPSAEKELRKARELGAVEESVLPLLASVYLAQNKYDGVQGLEVQSSFSKEVQASLLTSHGIALLRQGNSNKANESIAAAMRIQPELPYVLYGQAVLSIGSGDLEEARASLNQALVYNPGYAKAWDLLGDLEGLANSSELIEPAYTKAIENSKDINKAKYRLKRALLRIKMQRYDEAQQDVDNLKKNAPNLAGVNYAQGLLSFFQGKYPEALGSFILVLKRNVNFMPAIFYLGATNFKLKNFEQADLYLSQFISANPENIPARKMLATQKISQRDYQRAEELIRPIVNGASVDVLALNILANALMAQGKKKESIEILERVSNLQTESAVAKLRLGVGLLMEGEQSDAVANLESAIEMDPGLKQADVLLVLNYLRKKEYELAQQAAQDFIDRHPDNHNPVAHNLLGLVYMGKGQPEQAKTEFKKVIEIAPGDPAASHNLATLALRNSKPDEARELYLQVLERHENHLGTLLNLAAVEARLEDLKAMKATLGRAITTYPEAVRPRVLLARYYLLTKNIDKAKEVMADLDKKHPNSIQVLSMMGEIQLTEKDFTAARFSLDRLVDLQPNSAQAHYLLALAYAGLNRKEKMEQELTRALEFAPGHIPALIAQTRLQLLGGKLDEAKKNLAILKKTAAENPDVLAIEAFLSAKSGDKEQTLALLKQRYQISPSTKSLLALTRFNWTLGNRQEAINALEKWISDHPDDVAARIELADAFSAQGQSNKAIVQYEKILEISEDNVKALNNLAWHLRKTHTERALAYAERAYTLDPESATVMDTLSGLLLSKGELGRAQRLNMRALEKIPDSPSFLFQKAMILEATGKLDEATTVLRKILESQNKFPERAEAETMLTRLGG